MGSTTSTTSGEPPTCEQITAFADRVVDVGIDFDYQPTTSPAGAAAETDVALQGVLSGEFSHGAGAAGEFVAFGVEIAEVLAGSGGYSGGDDVLVSVLYNAGHVDPEEFEQAIAVGAPVVVFANESSDGRELVAHLEGFMTACDDAPLGWVGHTGVWPAMESLDDVATLASGGAIDRVHGSVRETIAGDVRLWSAADRGDGSGLGAQIAGSLGHDPDSGCVHLTFGGDRYPVVWPHDAELVDVDPLRIDAGGATGLTEGAEIVGGGGYVDAGSVDVDVPAECLSSTQEVAVFNQQDRIALADSS